MKKIIILLRSDHKLLAQQRENDTEALSHKSLFDLSQPTVPADPRPAVKQRLSGQKCQEVH